MDRRNNPEQYLEYLKQNSLELNDRFRFKCRACGNCCKNREDIL